MRAFTPLPNFLFILVSPYKKNRLGCGEPPQPNVGVFFWEGIQFVLLYYSTILFNDVKFCYLRSFLPKLKYFITMAINAPNPSIAIRVMITSIIKNKLLTTPKYVVKSRITFVTKSFLIISELRLDYIPIYSETPP